MRDIFKKQKLTASRNTSPHLIVVHVTDCMNAGTQEAVFSIVQEHANIQHHLLWSARSDAPGPTVEDLVKYFTSSSFWSAQNILKEAVQLRKYVKQINPDFVHLHSSRAGVIGRLCLFDCRIIYTSHGFGFQRRDISKFKQILFYLIEKILAHRTFHYAAIWPAELEIVRKHLSLSSYGFYPLKVMYGLAKESNDTETSITNTRTGKTILIVGRLTEAKDPEFAEEVQKYLSSKSSHLITWVGMPEIALNVNSTLLRDWSFRSVPWVDKTELNKYLENSALLLVTSKWEAGPLVFYEGLRFGIPSVVRPILSFTALGLETFREVEDFGNKVIALMSSPDELAQLHKSQIKSVLSYVERENAKNELYSIRNWKENVN